MASGARSPRSPTTRSPPTRPTCVASPSGAPAAGVTEPAAVRRTTLRRYLAFLTTRDYARRSIARKTAALRRYFRWLVRAGRPDGGPDDRACRHRRGDGRLPRVLDAGDVAALLDAPPPADEPAWRRRIATTPCSSCSTARACGSASCAGSTCDSLDLEQAAVVVWGKGSKQRRCRCPHRRWPRRGRGWPSATRWSPTPTGPSRGCCSATSGAPPHAPRRAPHPRPALAVPDAPARPAPQLRHPPARRGGRPPGGAGAARPQRRRHHAALHPRQPRTGCAAAYDLTHPPASMRSIVDRRPVPGAVQWDSVAQAPQPRSARDHLIVSYSPLVKFIAGRLGAGLPSTVDPADLVSSGILGLIDALERFDPGQGVKFETFATPADPRRDLRRVAPARLGASLGADQGAGHPTGDGELRGDERPLAERRGVGG